MGPTSACSSSRNLEGSARNTTLRTPSRRIFQCDARRLPNEIADASVDLIVTSPPYWRKRDYGIDGQIGREDTPEEYVKVIVEAMQDWRRVLRPSGSIFLNIGDTYRNKSLQGIPSLIEVVARQHGWRLRNRIVWSKKGGMPDPAQDRLAARHEFILHFFINGYYYDLFGYAAKFSSGGKGANPGDVWEIAPKRNLGRHLAAFPEEIVERTLTLACPEFVCSACGVPRSRIVARTAELDESRPQARRALEIARKKRLTTKHIEAIQATGISDAGKARKVQNGTDRNSQDVRKLAAEAKSLLGGYFREFTFAKKKSEGWTTCDCNAPFSPGVVLDPFMGSGTTLEVAERMGLSSIGIDLDATQVEEAK